jgi:predicted nucleic acid-binding protein
MIKPEFWDDEKLATVSRDARLLFVGLWSNSDDYGVVKGHPAWLKNRIIAATCVVNKATLITGNIKHYPMQDFEKKEVSAPS